MVSSVSRFPGLSNNEINAGLLEEVHQWCLANGLVIYSADLSSCQAVTIPLAMYPTPIPRDTFRASVLVQRSFNLLYAHIAQDKHGWLTNTCQELAKDDVEFTGRLWATYQKAKAIGISQKVALGIFRSDYFWESSGSIKQVEFNTVSVSFAGFAGKLGGLHNHLNSSGKYSVSGEPFYTQEIPVSESAVLVTQGIATAVRKYNDLAQSKRTVVAFIVRDGEHNVFDQRVLEYNLFDLHDIKSVRIPLRDVHLRVSLDRRSKKLYMVNSGEEISVVYFRAGYAPEDYVTSQDWNNRLLLETSFAIKAPNLLTQLSGTKKVQQKLTEPSVLSKFVPSDVAQELLPTFAEIYPLDDSKLGEIGKKLAFTDAENYVLKPQREGGGNNIYKQDIPGFLNTIPKDEWRGYILMKLIKPVETRGNVVIRGTEFFREPIVNELGIFGTILFSEDEIYSNEYAGWLLRSKFVSSNEGGIAAGFGCINGLVLQ